MTDPEVLESEEGFQMVRYVFEDVPELGADRVVKLSDGIRLHRMSESDQRTDDGAMPGVTDRVFWVVKQNGETKDVIDVKAFRSAGELKLYLKNWIARDRDESGEQNEAPISRAYE